MTKIIHYTLFYLQFIVMCVSLIFSLRLINNKNVPKYLIGFYWYPVVGFITLFSEVLINTFFSEYKKYAWLINNLSVIYHFCFLSLFIIGVLNYKGNLKYLYFIFFVFFVLIIVSLFSNNLFKNIPLAFSISNFGLVLFCILYYFDLFNNMPELDLKETPSFWIITGVLFCMGTYFPISATVDYLSGKVSILIIMNLNNVLIVCYIIMHLFFIKAYLCVPQRLKG
jgi:hypothetical protein